MKQKLFNSAAIFDIEGGLGELQVAIATRIANEKRRKVLCKLAVDQLTTLEELVREMEQEDVARLYEEALPVHSANGNGKL